MIPPSLTLLPQTAKCIIHFVLLQYLMILSNCSSPFGTEL